MVKKSVRKKVSASKQAATEKKPAEDEDAPPGAEEVDEEAEHDAALNSLPSHQKRKVTKKAKFREKIRVATANKMKASKKKKGLSAAFADFATLESTLGDIAGKGLSPGKNKVKVLRSKARTKLVESETGRMQAVLSHPQFQANPIAAISNHIVESLKKVAGAVASAPRAVSGEAGKPSGGGGEGGKGGAKGGGRADKTGKVVDVKVGSDEVALATQRRGAEASRRGIAFAGDGVAAGRRGAGAGALGVKYSNAKKKQGAKKGSKRSTKRAKEEW